jgi:hypothetical protein
MYIQPGLAPGRIGRVRLSQAGRTLYDRALVLESLAGRGYKANFIDPASHQTYWISGPRKDRRDTLYPGRIAIDDDVIAEYWRDIRDLPHRRDPSYRSLGVHGNQATR